MSYLTKKQLINEAIIRGKCSQGKFSTFIITGDWQEREMGGKAFEYWREASHVKKEGVQLRGTERKLDQTQGNVKVLPPIGRAH